MEYRIYKFEFTTGVHFGKKSLADAEFTLCADTLFSAMCHEYLKQGQAELENFVARVSEGKIRFSDAFPFIQNTYYLPKPMWRVTTEQESGDSSIKKAYKKLAYIPAEKLGVYLEGNLDVKQEENKFREHLGYKAVRASVAIRGEEKTEPYRVGIYYFKPQSGLYMILGYETEEDVWSMEDCLSALSLSGIGGKRSSGLGRYELKRGNMPQIMLRRLQSKEASVYMSLSGSLPKEEELEAVLEGANYLLTKRSGFVLSDTYAKEQQRKKDLYVFQAGSCFKKQFEGSVYDVGDGGNHPVYRYAKPLFMEVIS